MHALIVVAHHHPRSHTCPRRAHRRRRGPRRSFRGNRRPGGGRLRAALRPGRPRRASRPGVASRRRPRRAGAHRSRRYPGAGLPDLLVVDAGPAQGLDRSRVLQWLGLRLQHRRRPAESCSACAWCWSVSAAPMPAPSSGTATPGRCAPRSTMASSITAAHGWSVPNCCWNRRPPIRSGIWTRPCTSAASSSPHAARRGRPGAAAGGLTPGHSARCMAKPARCGASSSRRVSAGIR